MTLVYHVQSIGQPNNIAEPEAPRIDFAAPCLRLERIEGPAILNLYSDADLEKRALSSLPNLYLARQPTRASCRTRAAGKPTGFK